jgi:hypothetical protein
MWPHEWDACTWDLQQTYWEGFVQEKLVSTDETEGRAEGNGVPEIRGRTVDTGAGVIDLSAMRDELAAAR